MTYFLHRITSKYSSTSKYSDNRSSGHFVFCFRKNINLPYTMLKNCQSYFSDVSRDFLGIPFSTGEYQGRGPKGHNRELWTRIFSYKHVWMAWVEVMENVIIMHLSIVLDILLGESSFKITHRLTGSKAPHDTSLYLKNFAAWTPQDF